jgi:hypothetical protein
LCAHNDHTWNGYCPKIFETKELGVLNDWRCLLKSVAMLYCMLIPLRVFRSKHQQMVEPRGFKEAQSMVTLYDFVIIIPAFILATIPGIELNWQTHLFRL